MLLPLSLGFDNEVTEAQRYKGAHSRSLNGDQQNGGSQVSLQGCVEPGKGLCFSDHVSQGISGDRSREGLCTGSPRGHLLPWSSLLVLSKHQPFRNESVLAQSPAGPSSYTSEGGKKGYFPRSHKIKQIGSEVYLTYSRVFLKPLRPSSRQRTHLSLSPNRFSPRRTSVRSHAGSPGCAMGWCSSLWRSSCEGRILELAGQQRRQHDLGRPLTLLSTPGTLSP